MTLVDRQEPGSATSYGNAGVLANGSIVPEAAPEIWRRLFELLGNRSVDVHLHYRHLPHMLPYIARFLANTTQSRYSKNTESLNAILNRAVAAHRDLIRQCDADHLLKERGWLKIYRSESAYRNSDELTSLYEHHGIAYRRLSATELHELEPDLYPIYNGAIWVTGTASISDPAALSKSYADYFVGRGGIIETKTIHAITPSGDRWRVLSYQGHSEYDRVVIAMGAWSASILKPLGYRLPLIGERGYHRHYQPDNNASLNRPIHDVEGGFVIAPMKAGHRLTTGDEWAALDSPPTPVQLHKVEPLARHGFPLGSHCSDVWLGHRPATPDSIPVIGEVPGHRGLWLVTGHGHIGLTLGPISGQLLAAEMSGELSDIDMRPYSPARF